MARLIDSSVFISLERRGLPLSALTRDAPDEQMAFASVTASELLVGVERANSPNRRRERETFVERVFTDLPIVPFDLTVARVHARLVARLTDAGTLIGDHDLIIAATALAHGYDLLTLNVRDFGRVPGLVVLTPSW